MLPPSPCLRPPAPCALAYATLRWPALAQADPEAIIPAIVVLREQAEPERVARLAATPVQARALLVADLQALAGRTQAPLRAFLEAERAAGRVESYTPFWIFNGIAVRAHRRPSAPGHPAEVALVGWARYRRYLTLPCPLPSPDGLVRGGGAARRRRGWGEARRPHPAPPAPPPLPEAAGEGVRADTFPPPPPALSEGQEREEGAAAGGGGGVRASALTPTPLPPSPPEARGRVRIVPTPPPALSEGQEREGAPQAAGVG